MRPTSLVPSLIVGFVIALLIALTGGFALAQGKGGGKGGGGKDAPRDPVFAVLRTSGSGLSATTVDAAGTVVETLATDISFATAPPAPSPDGSRIALWLEFGAAGSGIYIAPADASTAPQLLSRTWDYVWGLAWSPVAAADGEFKIAWTEVESQGQVVGLHLVNEDGSEHTVLYQGDEFTAGEIEFSPDARWLGVASFDGRGFGLVELIDAGGTLAIGSVVHPASGYVRGGSSAPAWLSANQVVFSGDSAAAGFGLYRMDLSVGIPYLILAERTFGDFRPTRPDVHLPTGQILFEGYSWARQGGVSIFSCAADGSSVVQVTGKGFWRLPKWL